MNLEELRKSVLINLRCVTQSCKGGVLLSCLQDDYKSLIGENIPFKELGYSTLQSFLENNPDVICLKRTNDSQFLAEAVPDASTAHIASLISRQKSTKSTKKLKTTAVPRYRNKLAAKKVTHQKHVAGSSLPTKQAKKVVQQPLPKANKISQRKPENKQSAKLEVISTTYNVQLSGSSSANSSFFKLDQTKYSDDTSKFLSAYLGISEKSKTAIPQEEPRQMPNTKNTKAKLTTSPLKSDRTDGNVNNTIQKSFKDQANVNGEKRPVKLDSSPQSQKAKLITSPLKSDRTAGDANAAFQKSLKDEKKINGENKRPVKLDSIPQSPASNSTNETFGPKTEKINVLSIPEGNIEKKAVPLKRTSIFKESIDKANVSTVLGLHFLLYGGQDVEKLKKEIQEFSGFPFSEGSDSWKGQRRRMSKFSENSLKEFLNVFHLQSNNLDKNCMIEKLMDFFKAPSLPDPMSSGQKINAIENGEGKPSLVTKQKDSRKLTSKQMEEGLTKEEIFVIKQGEAHLTKKEKEHIVPLYLSIKQKKCLSKSVEDNLVTKQPLLNEQRMKEALLNEHREQEKSTHIPTKQEEEYLLALHFSAKQKEPLLYKQKEEHLPVNKKEEHLLTIKEEEYLLARHFSAKQKEPLLHKQNTEHMPANEIEHLLTKQEEEYLLSIHLLAKQKENLSKKQKPGNLIVAPRKRRRNKDTMWVSKKIEEARRKKEEKRKKKLQALWPYLLL